MSMKLVYIAGPYRSDTPAGVDKNISAAKDVATQVCELGSEWYPVTPHLNTSGFERLPFLRTYPDSYWLEGTMEVMTRCDAVLLVEENAGHKSAGTAAEIEKALSLNIPVFLNFEDFHRYVNFTL